LNNYQKVQETLKTNKKKWVITGVAGFIGSNLLETLLKLNQYVTGLDNFSTGHQHNLDEVKSLVTPEQWKRFKFINGDIKNIKTCLNVCTDADYVLHQAALGSVPRSINDPITTNENNISGFLNMLVAVRDSKVKRFVFAASSSTYGDHPALPKTEDRIGAPLSPYAVTKYVNELYADVFSKCYGIETVGLRYFNIFGQRQDPNGAYAAVIPLWFKNILNGEISYINGDGKTSRDFCFIENCVQANILAATTTNKDAINQIYNIAFGERTTLNELFALIKEKILNQHPEIKEAKQQFRDFRKGDVRHSLADISKAKTLLKYQPEYSVRQGLEKVAILPVR